MGAAVAYRVCDPGRAASARFSRDIRGREHRFPMVCQGLVDLCSVRQEIVPDHKCVDARCVARQEPGEFKLVPLLALVSRWSVVRESVDGFSFLQHFSLRQLENSSVDSASSH